MDLKILLYPGHRDWIAQVLEHDIAAQGATVDDAIYHLSRLIAGECLIRERHNHLSKFAEIQKAPQRFWDLYENAAFIDKHLAEFTPVPLMQTECRLAA